MTVMTNSTIDTRNKDWSKGSIGARLLGQMGWTEGTGLGKRRNGTAEPVRAIRQSREAAGIGSSASDTTGSQGWNRTTDGFASVLQALQEEHGDSGIATCNAAGEQLVVTKKKKKKKKSLTLAKNKVLAGHARKMREAKDLTTKSSADMAAIFGGMPFVATTTKQNKKRQRSTTASPVVVSTDTEDGGGGGKEDDEEEEESDEKEQIIETKKEPKKSKKKSKSSSDEEEKPKKKKRKKDKKK
eukprot:CAMPEP_0119003748 /NCGR_PEP_ID=MMETSP1176-20130426/744_1 /TAXON_ID=265551 /ORGANISM="Synedropsis recta cf, Strain CCMP1620" /LENGTH=241 /DNA_ID=CAMNT_0006955373 /DNA_START=23 /DNA_END=748 /DNA_ORIENTATION=+